MNQTFPALLSRKNGQPRLKMAIVYMVPGFLQGFWICLQEVQNAF